jgi:hypothetical protein
VQGAPHTVLSWRPRGAFLLLPSRLLRSHACVYAPCPLIPSSFLFSLLFFCRYTFTAVPGLALSCLRPGRAAVWAAWGGLPAQGWLAFGVLVAGVMVLAATAQVHAIRRLGPAGHAALQPLRLLSTVGASYGLLGERLSGAGQWVGLATVVGALGWYVAVGEPLSARSASPWAAWCSSAAAASDTSAEAQAARSALAKSRSRSKRWWFQRLLWPRPAFRPGRSALSASQQPAPRLFKDANNREVEVDRDKGGAHVLGQRLRRRPGDGADGGGGIVSGPRAGRAPGAAMAMVRSEADEAALDSDEDLSLLAALGPVTTKVSRKAKAKAKAAVGGARGGGTIGGASTMRRGGGGPAEGDSEDRGEPSRQVGRNRPPARRHAPAAAAARTDERHGRGPRETGLGASGSGGGGGVPEEHEGAERRGRRGARGGGGGGSDGGNSSGGNSATKGGSRRKKQRDRDRDDLRNISRSSRASK